MAKIGLDKYYTPVDLAKYCIDKVYEVIGEENITDVIEPSAGNGSFSLQVPKGCRAYDIEPEHESIVNKDFLTLEDEYVGGRLIIGNPPYGDKLYLAQKFYKKAIELGDYVAFILPISKLNNTNTMYEFDLIHSEDLGLREYSGRELHCCLNVYKRPSNGTLNKRSKVSLEDIEIIRNDSKKYADCEYDIRMCYWGSGSAGKILEDGEHYSGEYKIKIKNNDLKEEIIRALKNANWKSELNCIAMLKIQQFHIVNYLKRTVDGIK